MSEEPAKKLICISSFVTRPAAPSESVKLAERAKVEKDLAEKTEVRKKLAATKDAPLTVPPRLPYTANSHGGYGCT